MSSSVTVSSGPGADPPEVAGSGDRLLAMMRRRSSDDPITHVERVPARAGITTDWPGWVPAELRAALGRRGVEAPWKHQAEAAELAFAGRHVVIATGTASGKSLAYQLPALATLLADPRATVLYLAPTKALAADQVRARRRAGAGGHPPRLLRRGHPPRRAGLDPAPLPVRAHQPGHAAPRHPARQRAVDRLPAPALLRRRRRVPHVPGGLRLARGARAAAAAPPVRAVRPPGPRAQPAVRPAPPDRTGLRARLGDLRRSGRDRRAPHRSCR